MPKRMLLKAGLAGSLLLANPSLEAGQKTEALSSNSPSQLRPAPSSPDPFYLPAENKTGLRSWKIKPNLKTVKLTSEPKPADCASKTDSSEVVTPMAPSSQLSSTFHAMGDAFLESLNALRRSQHLPPVSRAADLDRNAQEYANLLASAPTSKANHAYQRAKIFSLNPALGKKYDPAFECLARDIIDHPDEPDMPSSGQLLQWAYSPTASSRTLAPDPGICGILQQWAGHQADWLYTSPDHEKITLNPSTAVVKAGVGIALSCIHADGKPDALRLIVVYQTAALASKRAPE